MKTRTAFSVALATLVAVGSACAATNDPATALQQALFEEEANHNLAAALQGYAAVVARFDQDRKLASTAVFRMGECYRKQGKTNDAVAQYDRVLREFADQEPLLTASRQRLAELRATAAAQPASAPGENAESILAGLAEDKEVRRIQAMIRNSPDLVNASDSESGMTPLQKAANLGQLAVAEFLINNGAEINARSKSGWSALHFAASQGHKALAEMLLAKGAAVDARDIFGNTALHGAARNGFKSLTLLLLDRKADANARNNQQETPLYLAVEAGRLEVADLLLDRGADVNAKTLLDPAQTQYQPGRVGGATPLVAAILNNHAELVRLLLEHKAEVNFDCAGRPPSASLYGPALTGQPLHFAILGKNLEIVNQLLKHGADPNARASVPDLAGGVTPLGLAVNARLSEIAQALLASGADPNLADHRQQTPLFYAVQAHALELVSLLVTNRADVNVREENNDTPLQWAVQLGQTDTTQWLLNHQANPNVRGRQGLTPLSIAAKDGRKDLAELLLVHGADPNLPDANGVTPLMLVTSPSRSSPGMGFAAAPGIPAPLPVRPLRLAGTPPAATVQPAQMAQFLREHGATTDLPRPDRIELRRSSSGYSAFPFYKGTNDWNHFTLLELVGVQYGFLTQSPTVTPGTPFQTPPVLAFPDFSRVRLLRLAADGKTRQEQTVDLSPIFLSADCSVDLPLRWGDVVDIPEADHVVGAAWQGFSETELTNAAACLRRQIQIVVKGRATSLTLAPRSGTRSLVIPARPYGPVSQADASFWIKPVLLSSGLVLSSSDLAHVRVTRATPGSGQKQAWTVDCSDLVPAPDFWLEDGDVIDVPDKP